MSRKRKNTILGALASQAFAVPVGALVLTSILFSATSASVKPTEQSPDAKASKAVVEKGKQKAKKADNKAAKSVSSTPVPPPTPTRPPRLPLTAKLAKNGAVCPETVPEMPTITEADVYKDVPFQAGEASTFEVRYFGVLAGYGTIEVKKPKLYNGVLHRRYTADASTGDWFRTVYIAKDRVEALSRSWDWGVAYFEMEQDEGKIFRTPFRSHKWLDFNQYDCRVNEREEIVGKPARKKTYGLSYGAMDALGVLFHMRTKEYKLGKVERAPVYTSEKNWFLEAMPVAFETVEVPAGKYEAVKLKLTTYFGKEMQQKGDVYAWIATKDPARPIIQVQGEIKIGSVWMKLSKFEPGKK
jgi:hypothetical protein